MSGRRACGRSASARTRPCARIPRGSPPTPLFILPSPTSSAIRCSLGVSSPDAARPPMRASSSAARSAHRRARAPRTWRARFRGFRVPPCAGGRDAARGRARAASSRARTARRSHRARTPPPRTSRMRCQRDRRAPRRRSRASAPPRGRSEGTARHSLRVTVQDAIRLVELAQLGERLDRSRQRLEVKSLTDAHREETVGQRPKARGRGCDVAELKLEQPEHRARLDLVQAR